jgi:superfamily II DNA or RNA helicase
MTTTSISQSDLSSVPLKNDALTRRGFQIFDSHLYTLTFQDGKTFRYLIEDRLSNYTVDIRLSKDGAEMACSCALAEQRCSHIVAAMLALREYLAAQQGPSQGEKYSREEMISRVTAEREEKAASEPMKMRLGETVFGIHNVTGSGGVVYQVTIREFEPLNGYCSCPDFHSNKLGFCKHLLFAAEQIRKRRPLYKKIQQEVYPFGEIYCDPLHDYHITYSHIDEHAARLQDLFQNRTHLSPERYPHLLTWLQDLNGEKNILIRPEVYEKIERHFNQRGLQRLAESETIDFSALKMTLFPYQQQGAGFAVFKSGCIIADEMGLGKTAQAIAVAINKKRIFDFKRTLIVCPATLKQQWQKEIARFCHEKAEIIQGPRPERLKQYKESDAYFLITNYESLLRDIIELKKYAPDFMILDEAQRIKNYATKTANAVKAVPKKHGLVITGTPIENRLIDLYSITQFVDPELLAPLWEFSMNHCYFDKSKKNKITGYYNLQSLKEKMNAVLIRREKQEVLQQLPPIQEMIVPIQIAPEQAEIHAGLVRSLTSIINKKHLNFFDLQRIQQILTSMRMVCDSTYLIDKETNISPKLAELQDILLEQLDLKQRNKKILIFSEWKTMLHLIANLLRKHDIGFVTLSSDVAVEKRGALIDEFSANPDCKVFLSTEAGGAGLNLQCADTVINFELPWNPAKKNQRIGRVHRLGQTASHITVINLVAQHSIESRIAEGLVLKESLFEAVLNQKDMNDEVDFSRRGQATFIQELQTLVSGLEAMGLEEIEQLAQDSDAVQPEGSADVHVDAEESEKLPSEPAATFDQAALQQTLDQGLQFLNGIFKMATGNSLLTEEQTINVDADTGEVTIKFKLPKMGKPA